MKIIVDVFGGDNAPGEILKGSEMAAKECGCEIILVGNKEKIKNAAAEAQVLLDGFEIHHAESIMTAHDPATEIVKSKNDSSMAEAFSLLRKGEGDAFVSAGNSGAMAVGATLIAKRIKGVKRCAFAPVIPKINGFFMLVDSGANIECRPEMLCQFAEMGSIYMQNIMVVDNPRVGLVNIGAEETKGDELRFETYKLLKESGLNFVGNIEAREIPMDAADVVVTDGFTGNIILKLYEGMASTIFRKIKDVFGKNFKTKFAASVIAPELKAMKAEMDYNEYGGAVILGCSKPVFKAHGSAKAKTFKNAIRLASECVKRSVTDVIAEKIKQKLD